MLIEPSRTIPEIMSKLVAEDFQNDVTRACFNKIAYLYNENRPIDTVTVISNLPSEYRTVVVQMVEALPGISNFRNYIFT